MAILHIRFPDKAPTTDGREVAIKPSDFLRQKGPLVQVSLGLGRRYSEELAQQGKPVPAPLSGLGLIDTGASVTCIDDVAAQQLGLPVIDVRAISSASHANAERNVYPALIEILGSQIRFDGERVLGAELSVQGLLVLIGRDLLQHATLHYNGPFGEFTLCVG